VRTITAGRKFLRRKDRTRTFKLGFRNDEADLENQKDEKKGVHSFLHYFNVIKIPVSCQNN
jgi:hypothetical protein